MTGIYRRTLWYNRAAAVIICLVLARTVAISLLWAAVASTGAAQGEPERRPPTAPTTAPGVGYLYSWFQGERDPWHLASFSAGTQRAGGALIGRIEVARRFAENGVRGAIEALPTIDDRTYAHLNVGYSASALFPEWRLGGEVFRSLSRAVDASLGFHYLGFSTQPVRLLTGSISATRGTYWLSLTPRLRAGDKASASASVIGRHYYAGLDSYVGARIGYGKASDENAAFSQLTRTSAVSAGLQGSRPSAARTVATWVLNFEREGRPSGPSINRWEIGGGLRLRY